MNDTNLDNREVTLLLPYPISQSQFNIFYNLNNDNSSLIEIKKISDTEIIVPTSLFINIISLLPILNKENYFRELSNLNKSLVIEQINSNILFIKPIAIIRGVQNYQLGKIFEKGLHNVGFWEKNGFCQFGIEQSGFDVFIGTYLIPDFFFLTNDQFNSRSRSQLANESCPFAPYMVMENRSSSWSKVDQYDTKMFTWILSGCKIAILVDSIDKNCKVFSSDTGVNSLFPQHNQVQYQNNSFRVQVYNWNINNDSIRPPPLNIELAGILKQIVLAFDRLTLPSINNVIIPPYNELSQNQQMVADSVEVLYQLLGQQQQLAINNTYEKALESLIDYQRNIVSTNNTNISQSIQIVNNLLHNLQQNLPQFSEDRQNQINSYHNAIAQIKNIIQQNQNN